MRLAALVLVAFFPSLALAQNSTTTCRPYGFGEVRCDTQAQPGLFQPTPPVDYTGLLRPVPPPNAALNAYEAARAQSRQRLVDQVAPLMAAGQCETARLLAVRERDAEMADLIYSTCKPR